MSSLSLRQCWIWDFRTHLTFEWSNKEMVGLYCNNLLISSYLIHIMYSPFTLFHKWHLSCGDSSDWRDRNQPAKINPTSSNFRQKKGLQIQSSSANPWWTWSVNSRCRLTFFKPRLTNGSDLGSIHFCYLTHQTNVNHTNIILWPTNQTQTWLVN